MSSVFKATIENKKVTVTTNFKETCLLSQLLSKVTVTSCRSSAGILHGCLRQDSAPSHTARNAPTYLWRENVMFIEPHMWPQTAGTWIQSIALFGVPFNRLFINVDDSRQSTSWSRQSSLNGTNYCSVSSIAPLVSGVAGLSDSFHSKANKLNIWYKNCSTWVTLDNRLPETINTLFKVIQGHPRSSRLVPIESPYATFY